MSSPASRYFDAISRYYKLKNQYFDLNLELSDEEEDKLCDELNAQEDKVVDMLHSFVGDKLTASQIRNILLSKQEEVLKLFAKFAGGRKL